MGSNTCAASTHNMRAKPWAGMSGNAAHLPSPGFHTTELAHAGLCSMCSVLVPSCKRSGLADEVLYFDGEFDRVYDAPKNPLHLQDGTSTLQIEQSPSWANSVVWNPGEGKCATLADMPAHGFARMLCVEAAQVFEPISIPAGGQWVGWQRLTVS